MTPIHPTLWIIGHGHEHEHAVRTIGNRKKGPLPARHLKRYPWTSTLGVGKNGWCRSALASLVNNVKRLILRDPDPVI